MDVIPLDVLLNDLAPWQVTQKFRKKFAQVSRHARIQAIRKTDEEIAQQTRRSSIIRATVGFILTLLIGILSDKFRVHRGYIRPDPMTWLQIFMRTPYYLIGALIIGYASYKGPWSKPTNVVGCLRCGKTLQGRENELCECGGRLVKAEYLKWGDPSA
jgi:hypothetical protein